MLKHENAHKVTINRPLVSRYFLERKHTRITTVCPVVGATFDILRFLELGSPINEIFHLIKKEKAIPFIWCITVLDTGSWKLILWDTVQISLR